MILKKLPITCKHGAWEGIHGPKPAHFCRFLQGECKPIQEGREKRCQHFEAMDRPETSEGRCVHLGAFTGQQVECCGGKKTDVYECVVREKCAPSLAVHHEVTGCGRCMDREARPISLPKPEKIVKIDLPKHYNCSLIEWRGQPLLASRVDKNPAQICLSALDEEFRPIWTQPLLMEYQHKEISAEDPRFFVFQNQLCLSFTTYEDKNKAATVMYATLSSDLQVEYVYRPNYAERAAWEKNWMFFEHDNSLYSIYAVNPHTILRHDKEAVSVAHRESHKFRWTANMRGGAAPVLVGSEYFHWFHTMSHKNGIFRYSMGLYTFDAKPPFAIRRVINEPLMTPDEEDRPANWNKSVIYPSGAILRDGKWLVSYGYHDRESRIAIFDAKAIERAMQPLAHVEVKKPASVLPSTWCISCREMPERRDVAVQHFNAQKMKVNFFDALHGRSWGIRATHESSPGYTIPSGHAGLDITYWALWQTLLRQPGDEFLIFEDDVILGPDFVEEFTKAKADLPEDWQFLYVGHLGMDDKDSVKVSNRMVRLNPSGTRLDRKYPHGTHAFLVRKSALEHLLRTARADHHFDQHLAKVSMPGLRAYACVPSLASQRSYGGEWGTSCGISDGPPEAVEIACEIPGWMSRMELEWLHQTASALYPGSSWLEIGAFRGRSTMCVGLSLPGRCTLHVVDGWDNLAPEYMGYPTTEIFAEFQRNMEILRKRRPDLKIQVWKMKNADDRLVRKLANIDAAFIDGDHTQEAVTRDSEDCLAALKPNGILAGHDYRPGANDDVIIAVDKLFPYRQLHDTIWHLRKQ